MNGKHTFQYAYNEKKNLHDWTVVQGSGTVLGDLMYFYIILKGDPFS